MKKIEIKSASFQRNLKKAIETKPLVKCLKFHEGNSTIGYLVRGSNGDFYPVRFRRGTSGDMFYSCLCAAGVADVGCYHLAAALLAHSGFVGCVLRPAAPFRSEISENAAAFFADLPAKLAYRGDESVRNLI